MHTYKNIDYMIRPGKDPKTKKWDYELTIHWHFKYKRDDKTYPSTNLYRTENKAIGAAHLHARILINENMKNNPKQEEK